MPMRFFNSPHLAPDKGEFGNDAWVEIVNAMPIGIDAWAPLSRMRQTLELTATTSTSGAHVHPGHGTDGWTIYYGTGAGTASGKLYAVDMAESIAGTSEADVSGATYDCLDDTAGWQFTAFRDHEIAVCGHNEVPQIRLDGSGNFEDLIENQEPTPFTIIQGWQEDNSGAPDYVDSTDALNSAFGEDTQQVFPAGAGADDAHYFGLSNAATALRINVETAGVGTYTITWEFWNGSAWTALSGVDAVNGLTGADIANGEHFKAAGVAVITYTFPSTWEETTVNGSRSLFFLRARRDGGNVTTDPVLNEADPVSGNWPPKPRYVANFRGRLAIANIQNVGLATAGGTNTDQYLLWVSADNNPRRFGMASDPNHFGERTGFYYLDDNDGPITGLAGGADFGAVFKPNAAYLVIYDSPLGLEFRQKGARVGCIYPNSLVWVGEELYFWSSQGPAVMTIDGVRILGIETEGISLVQRTIYDDTWIGGTYPITTTRASHWAMVHGVYSKVSDVMTWFYRQSSPTTLPYAALHYHRRTSRITFSQHATVYRGDDASPQTQTLANPIGSLFSPALSNPYPEDTRFSPNNEMAIIGPTNPSGTANAQALWLSDPDGTINWAHQPKWSTPYIGPARRQDGRPLEEQVNWIRPLLGLNNGASAAPTIKVTVQTKQKTAATSTGSENQTVEDAPYGVFRVIDAQPALYNKITVELCTGDDTLANLDNMSEFDGLEFWAEPGGGP